MGLTISGGGSAGGGGTLPAPGVYDYLEAGSGATLPTTFTAPDLAMTDQTFGAPAQFIGENPDEGYEFIALASGVFRVEVALSPDAETPPTHPRVVIYAGVDGGAITVTPLYPKSVNSASDWRGYAEVAITEGTPLRFEIDNDAGDVSYLAIQITPLLTL